MEDRFDKVGPEIETIELQQFKMICLQYLSAEGVTFGEPLHVTIHSDIARWGAQECAIRLVQKVWGKEVQRQECKWPADWWQAFKERWYPAWATKRWPVEYHIETMVARELYPQVALPPDRYKAVIAVEKSGGW